jgi:hypothetical protein
MALRAESISVIRVLSTAEVADMAATGPATGADMAAGGVGAAEGLREGIPAKMAMAATRKVLATALKMLFMGDPFLVLGAGCLVVTVGVWLWG